MENVVAFNTELSGLYDTKPPISKAKMAAITKAAMRAIKFYKHVVQSVEKFILKCKPEYKVPGLYVIDSIVRQSRHQYGAEKDVFAPRFARNMAETFANLFRCAPDDKSRIIRVLNLWQKNSVFEPEVIQPIFDLADPSHPIYQLPQNVATSGGTNDMTNAANGSMSGNNSLDNSMNASTSNVNTDDKIGGAVLPDLSNNNLKQLLNDPNVLRQLQTLQNFTKFKQQEDKQHKMNEMIMQEEAFEKHLQNVLKTSSTSTQPQESHEYNAEVEFVSMEQNIEVINLDGNDSRSPSPERDRYKRRRSRSNSRTRDRRGGSRDRRRRSRSRSTERSRSPRSNRRRNSRDRDRSNRDKDRDREHDRERRKKGLPELKKEHLSVCSTTLWVGHLSKLVYQEELSDTFGEFGDIVSIDQIVPRGCAFIVMNRRQDAYKAMQNLKNHKLQGRAITISWAAGKGVKSKEWKDYWDLELGVTYIPWGKIDENTDFDSLEEGGMFDEDSMPSWIKEKIQLIKSLKDKSNEANNPNQMSNVPGGGNLLFGIDTTQPPPVPPGPPPLMSMSLPGQFSMAPPISGPPRPLLGPMGMSISGMPMPPNLMAPPHAMMMPPGMMPPGYPPMSAPGPPPLGAPPMGIPPPGAPPFGPPPAANALPANATPASSTATVVNSSNEDHMDMDMDDDESGNPSTPSAAASVSQQMNFNQPPPSFVNVNAAGNNSDANGVGEIFSRDRNRPPSRWSTGSRGNETDNDTNADRWRDNGAGNFNNDNRNGNRPTNIMDINNAPQRPDFVMDNRGGRGGGGPSRGPDFFPNMHQQMPQNRFNQPTSLLQMRIPPPPNMFNPRMGGGPNGGGPMFMRGGPHGGGNAGGRQQGPGGFFNPRNPFSDGGRGRGGRMMDNRGGGRGARNSFGGGPPGNWSDEEGDDVVFNRRGGGGNRFREDRGERGDRGEDRNFRGPRRGSGGDRSGSQRGDRKDFTSNRRNSRGPEDDKPLRETEERSPDFDKLKATESVRMRDTEEDWDHELKEYDGNENTEKSPLSATISNSNNNDNSNNNNKLINEDNFTHTDVANGIETNVAIPTTTTTNDNNTACEIERVIDEMPQTYREVVSTIETEATNSGNDHVPTQQTEHIVKAIVAETIVSNIEETSSTAPSAETVPPSTEVTEE